MALLLSSGAAVGRGADTPDDRWRPHGNGLQAQARWTARDGLRVQLQCDPGEPRVVLRLSGDHLPSKLPQLLLAADGTAVAYPVERTGVGARPAFVTRIALDAPILDRMLVARAFALKLGERTVAAGVPGGALARVVRACRAHHWPR
ncbi:MAG TPA: hypothetical protein VIG54_05770 [Lysobacter sp.]